MQTNLTSSGQYVWLILSAVIIMGCHNGAETRKNIDTTAMATDTVKQATQNGISGYAPVNGLRMYYEIHGKGEPLVLIHGGGSTIKTSFANILPLLAAHYKVIAVELQAHGHTSDRNEPESFTQDANDVAALLAWLKTDSAYFAGFSNGGQTATEIAIRHPAIVKKLVVISAFYTREGAIKGFFEGMQHATLSNMPVLLQSAYLEIPGNNQQGLQAMFEKDKERMLHFKGWSDEELATIKAPTLIIGADKDVATPEHTVEMSEKIPHSSLVILPGTHGSFIGEICTAVPGSQLPAMTVTLIKEFLDKKQ